MCVVLYIFRVFVIIHMVKRGVWSIGDSTLTTAMVREGTSLKPTTFRRSINVEKDVEISSTLVDMYQYEDARRKKGHNNRSYIWKWDHWCQLQPKKGNCEKNVTKFFYDSQIDQCSPFFYSGCDGNKNNFETLVDCERHCKEFHTRIHDLGAGFRNERSWIYFNPYNSMNFEKLPRVPVLVKDQSTSLHNGANIMNIEYVSQPTFCYLQPDVGLCLALITKYYFNINEKSCKKFMYGGCGGNQNKFDTMYSCVKTCKGM